MCVSVRACAREHARGGATCRSGERIIGGVASHAHRLGRLVQHSPVAHEGLFACLRLLLFRRVTAHAHEVMFACPRLLLFRRVTAHRIIVGAGGGRADAQP